MIGNPIWKNNIQINVYHRKMEQYFIIITHKENVDGQKAQVKGRLVAKLFQEEELLQLDLPTMLRESLKLVLLWL